MDYSIDDLLNKVADELDITDTQYENIDRSYNSVAEELNKSSVVNQYGNIIIFPQGSVSLGTIVKPLKTDEYDVDMVCYFDNSSIPLNIVKQSVGDAIKDNGVYVKKLIKEGKRCWTLEFDGYHMDILPSKKDDFPSTFEGENSIIATNKEPGSYLYKPVKTNPKGYLRWFLSRSRLYLLESKRSFSIENLKDYPRKSVLQKTVQILKRHRDVYFEDNILSDHKPISIIITTLAAHVYNGENSILELLERIKIAFTDYINVDNGYQILNPVNSEENFAEKWNLNPDKPKAFFAWFEKLKADIDILKSIDKTKLPLFLKQILGEKTVNNIYDAIGNEMKQLRESQQLKSDRKAVLNTVSGVSVASHIFYGKEKNSFKK